MTKRHTSRQLSASSDLSRRLLPPPLRSVRWVAVGPGGGVCGAVARTKRRSDNIRAVAVVPPLRCAAFRHVGARRVSPGPPLRPAGCRARLNRRPNAAVASLGAARRVGETRSRWSACGSSPFASAAGSSARSARPGARGDRAARLRLLSRAVSSQHVPLERLHGRRRFARARAGLRCASPDHSGEKRRRFLEHPRRHLRLAFYASLRARAAAHCVRLLRGLAPRAQTKTSR